MPELKDGHAVFEKLYRGYPRGIEVLGVGNLAGRGKFSGRVISEKELQDVRHSPGIRIPVSSGKRIGAQGRKGGRNVKAIVLRNALDDDFLGGNGRSRTAGTYVFHDQTLPQPDSSDKKPISAFSLC